MRQKMKKSGYRELDTYIAALRGGEAPSGKDVTFTPTGADGKPDEAYTVHVFNEEIAGLLRADYSAEDLAGLAAATDDLRRIGVVKRPWGAFIMAASFDSDETAESTNYDAIWVRDSIWGYLALAADPGRQDDAKAVLLTQLDYMASQAERMDRAIKSPKLLDLPGSEGDMNAVHIRFDSGWPDFRDIMDGDAPQRWTHKQNDALGLVIDAALTAYAEGHVALSDLTAGGASGYGPRLTAIARLVAYLNAVKYYTMEDSGAWEELPRRNTSSIGIVVSALEKLDVLLSGKGETATAFADAYLAAADGLGLDRKAGKDAITKLIAKGYDTVRRQLSLGGESPDYEADDPRYRSSDAALLSLIYPACPRELSTGAKLSILDNVGMLIGKYGIRRYEDDNYQSGNFWWHDIRTDADPESHKKRKENFIPGTETEWFFDSWYAKCCLVMASEVEKNAAFFPPPTERSRSLSIDPASVAGALRQSAVKHLNRALGQITGEGMYAADGRPVPAMAPPESVGHIVAISGRPGEPGETWPAPSPIAPLNWAKASLTLALGELTACGQK
jgi:hypothetical protein